MNMYRNEISRNIATIQKVTIRPYDGADMKTGWRTMAWDSDGMLYHVSVFETRKEAENDLKEMCFNTTSYCSM